MQSLRWMSHIASCFLFPMFFIYQLKSLQLNSNSHLNDEQRQLLHAADSRGSTPITPDTDLCAYLPHTKELIEMKPWKFGLFMNGYNNLTNSLPDDLLELSTSSMMQNNEGHILVAVKRIPMASGKHVGINPMKVVISECGSIPWVSASRLRLESAGVSLLPLPTAHLERDTSYATDVWQFMVGVNGMYYVLGESHYDTSTIKALEGFLRLIYDPKYFMSEFSSVVMWGHGNMHYGLPNSAMSESDRGRPRDAANRVRKDLLDSERKFAGLSANDIVSVFNRHQRFLDEGSISYSGKVFNVLGFDACLMANYELLTMLIPFADYVVASEVNVSSFGWNYADVAGRDQYQRTLKPNDLSRNIIDSYAAPGQRHRMESWSMSAFDMQMFKLFTVDFDLFLRMSTSCFGGEALIKMFSDAADVLPKLEDCTSGSLQQCYCLDMKHLLSFLSSNAMTMLSNTAALKLDKAGIERDLVQPVGRMLMMKQMQVIRQSFARSVYYLRQVDDNHTGSGFGVLFDGVDSLSGMSIYFPSNGVSDNCGSKWRQKNYKTIHESLNTNSEWTQLWPRRLYRPGNCFLSQLPEPDSTPSWKEMVESNRVDLRFDKDTYQLSSLTMNVVTDLYVIRSVKVNISGVHFAEIISADIHSNTSGRSSQTFVSVASANQPDLPLGVIIDPSHWCGHDTYAELCGINQEGVDGLMLMMLHRINGVNRLKLFTVDLEDDEHWRILWDDNSTLDIQPAIFAIKPALNPDGQFPGYSIELTEVHRPVTLSESIFIPRVIPEASPMGTVVMAKIPLIHSNEFIILSSESQENLTRPQCKVPVDLLLYEPSHPAFLSLHELMHGSDPVDCIVSPPVDPAVHGDELSAFLTRSLSPLEPSEEPPHFPHFSGDCDTSKACCSDNYVPYYLGSLESSNESQDVILESLESDAYRQLIQWSEDGGGSVETKAVCIQPSSEHATCIPHPDSGTSLCLCQEGFDGADQKCVLRPMSPRWTASDGVPTFILQYYLDRRDPAADAPLVSLKLSLAVLLDGLWQRGSVDLCAVDYASEAGASVIKVTIHQPYRSRYFFPFVGAWRRKVHCRKLVESLFQGLGDAELGLPVAEVKRVILQRFLDSSDAKSLYRSGVVAICIHHHILVRRLILKIGFYMEASIQANHTHPSVILTSWIS
eukprot:GHVH01009795.1.p1 GENE.GHVH01009795.1~~GHVH01009795.1.p1  ORF type:complete len:1164 (+),score=157.48 GHVH01009795.1:95-3586(+)